MHARLCRFLSPVSLSDVTPPAPPTSEPPPMEDDDLPPPVLPPKPGNLYL